MEWHNSGANVTIEMHPPIETRIPAWRATDHEVGLTEARDLIARSKRANPGQPSAGLVNREALDAVLAQKDCQGVRIYFAQKADGVRTLVIVGMDEFGNDLDEGLILDRLPLCPPLCPVDSALDS
jgi:hypothetical protein